MSTTITRKQYSGLDVESTWTETGNTGTILGLDYKEVQKEFDGSVSEGGVSIDDAFDVDEINIDDSHSTGIASLVGKIAIVQQQERCMPTEFDEAPVVSGYAVTTQSSETEDALVADLTTEKEATLEEATLTDDVKSALVSVLQAQGLVCKELKVWKASTEVSTKEFNVQTLMERTGYSVDGSAQVVWSPMPYSLLKTLPLDVISEIFQDVKTKYGTTWDDEFLSLTPTTGLSVDEDGVISGTPSGNSRIMFEPNGDVARQFISCTADGTINTIWIDNPRIALTIMCAIPKISMNSIIGFAGAFSSVKSHIVGQKWMIDIHKNYGAPIYKLIESANKYGIKTSTIESALNNNVYIDVPEYNWFDTNVYTNSDMKVDFNLYSLPDTTPVAYYFGVDGNWDSEGMFGLCKNQGGEFMATVQGDSTFIKTSTDGLWLKGYMSCKGYSINELTGSYSKTITDNKLTLTLLHASGCNKGGRIKYLKISSLTSGTLQHYYIPCATNAMLDLVTGEVIANQGIGTAQLVYEV